MVVRLKDVARHAGVSPRTVSNVVNDYPYVRVAMRARVQAAIDELGYLPNLAARNLRRGKTGTIALALPDLRIPYFAELANHVLRAADLAGLTLLIEQTDGDRMREIVATRGRLSKAIDGLILSPLAVTADDLPTGPDALPFVVLGERMSGGVFDHVAIDNVAAAREATLHLAGFGRRRIAAVGVARPGTSIMADLRLRGYSEALSESGLSYDESLIVGTDGYTRREGYEATRKLIASGAAPDALFCFNDLLAHGALRALAEVGLSCPSDVAIVGVDDIGESLYSVPSLTSISPDTAEIARRAIALLVNRIDGGYLTPSVDEVVGFSLAVRESAP